MLDVNTATKDELMEINGIGSVTADKIISARPFKSLADLTSLSRIGETQVADWEAQGLFVAEVTPTTSPTPEVTEPTPEVTEPTPEVVAAFDITDPSIPENERKELKALEGRIQASNIVSRKKNNLRIATWNIRNFGATKTERAVRYIATVCRNFDIIAIQEVKDSLSGLEKLQKYLGPNYRFIFSDPAGNTERLAFVYDKDRVDATGLAAEIVMRPGRGKEEEEIARINKKMEGMSDTEKARYLAQIEAKKAQQKIVEFDRTPYMVSFRANDSNFVLVTVHIYYGSGTFIEFREQEITNFATFIQKRAEDQDAIDPDFIVLGDFNIPAIDDKFFNALRSGGLIVPKEIQALGTNLSKSKHYDQIAYHRYPDSSLLYTGRANIIDFVGAVYTDMPTKLQYRLTDHLLLWAEFTVSPDKNPRRINP